MRKVRLFGSVLLPLALLIGCAPTPPPAPIAAGKLCSDWRHETIRKADALTEETAAQIEANNKSRPNWGCAYGENAAAKKG